MSGKHAERSLCHNSYLRRDQAYTMLPNGRDLLLPRWSSLARSAPSSEIHQSRSQAFPPRGSCWEGPLPEFWMASTQLSILVSHPEQRPPAFSNISQVG